jgi:DNA-binding LacI/PurR family transcriptional regulator
VKGDSKRIAMPTIADVAKIAGVSRAVASRALSPEKRPVSVDKRERVLAAAEALGYRVNLLAQSLTTKTVNLIAVVVNHIHDLSDLDLFDLLLGEIQAAGKQIVLVRVGSEDKIGEFLRRGIAYHVDAALVFSDFADAETVRRMFRSDLVVMLNGRHDLLSPAVIADEGCGIEQAVADAAAKGVCRASLLTGRASSQVEQARIACFHRSFEQYGIRLLQTAQGDYSYRAGHALAGALVAPDCPDAIFCTSDAMAMGILDACRADFPENCPARFRLYGFDNLSLLDFDAYPISSIGYDKAAYIEQILRILIEPPPAHKEFTPVLVPTRFVPRLTG